MRRRVTAVAVGLVALIAPLGLAQAASAAPPAPRLVVDDDGAQCGGASYGSIGSALADAVDGTTIVVCPGLYEEQVHVTKRVRIVGPVDAVSTLDCFAVDPAKLAEFGDTTRLAVLQPPPPATTEATEPVVTLDADDVELAGLVIQGVIDQTPVQDGLYPLFVPAVSSSDAHSGYWVHHNLVRSNTLGLELGSSGGRQTRLQQNCLRDNEWDVSNQRLGLADAVIDGNSTFRTGFIAFEIGWGYRAASSVTLRENDVRQSGWGIIIENSTDMRVSGNHVAAAAQRGIWVSAGNSGVDVVDNVVVGGSSTSTTPTGIATSLSALDGGVLPQSTGVAIRGNTVSGIRTSAGATLGYGIAAFAGSLRGATIAGNVAFDNGQTGIAVFNNNVGNVVKGNRSDDNGLYGIRVQLNLSTGNDLRGNTMHGNGVADASDTTDPNPADGIQLLNTWTDNDCVTDIPVGAICGVG